jgi:copper/silver efflux system protein
LVTLGSYVADTNHRDITSRPLVTHSGAQISIAEVAKVFFSRGPAMIRDEDGQLTGYV